MGIGKIIGIVAGVLGAVIAALAIYISTLDVDDFIVAVQGAVQDATGRELGVSSQSDLSISLTPTVTLKDLTFQNADWGNGPHMVKAETVELKLALLPLLSGRMEINNLNLTNVDLLIETSKDGKANYEFDGNATPDTTTDSDQQAILKDLMVGAMDVTNIRLTRINGETGEKRVVTVNELDFSADSVNDPLNVLIDVDLDDQKILAKGKMPRIRDLVRLDGFYDFDLEGEAMGHEFAFRGGVKFDVGDTGLSRVSTREMTARLNDIEVSGGVSVGLSGERPSVSGELAVGKIDLDKVQEEFAGEDDDDEQKKPAEPGKQGNPSEQLKVADADLKLTVAEITSGKFKLSGLENSIVLKNGELDAKIYKLLVAVGEQQANVSGGVTVRKGHPAITLDINADSIDLVKLSEDMDDLGEGRESDDAGEAPGDPMDRPFPLDDVRRADALIKAKITSLTQGKIEVTNLDVHAELKKGRLTLHPSTGVFSGGRMDASARFDGSKDTPDMKVDLKWTGADFGQMAAQFADFDLVSSKGDTELHVTATGKTPREMLNALNGVHFTVVEGGKIESKIWDLFAADLIKKAMTLGGDEKTKNLNCIVQRHEIENGLADAKVLLIDGQDVTIAGEGTVHLGKEELDMKISPNPKDPALFSLATPVLVSGNWSSPTILPDPVSVAKGVGTIALGVTVNPLIFASAFLDEGSDEPPCQQAIVAARTGKMPEKTAKKESSNPAAAITNSITNIIPGTSSDSSGGTASDDAASGTDSGNDSGSDSGGSNPLGGLFNNLKKLGGSN